MRCRFVVSSHHRLALLILSLVIAGCPAPAANVVDASDANSRVKAQTRAQFEGLYQKWEESQNTHAARLRSDDSYATGPEYEALVAMGKAAVPLLLERIAAGDFRMNDAVETITRVDILAEVRARPDKSWGLNQPPFGAQGTSRLWLAWWEKNQASSEWYP